MPCGVAVDSANVFWSEPGFFVLSGTRIGRANKNTGGGADPNFIGDASGPCGVARDGSRLYWTNAGNGTIARANADGTVVEESFIEGAGGKEEICGVAIDEPELAAAAAPDRPARARHQAPVAKISEAAPGRNSARESPSSTSNPMRAARASAASSIAGNRRNANRRRPTNG